MKNALKPQLFSIALVVLLLGSGTTSAQDDPDGDAPQASGSTCLDSRGIPSGPGPTPLLLLGQLPDGSNVYEPTTADESAPDCGLGDVYQCGDEPAEAYILLEDLDVLCAQQSTATRADPCQITIHFDFTRSAAACREVPAPEPCEIVDADLPGPCGGSLEVCDVYDAPEVCHDYTPPGLCDIYNGAPGTCGNPPPPTNLCSYYEEAPGTCGNPPPPTDPCDPNFINSGLCDFDICDVNIDIPRTCGNPPPPTDLCSYYDEAPATCGNPPPPTDPCDPNFINSELCDLGPCDVYSGLPGTCGNPPPPTDLCSYYDEAPGTCGNPPPPTGLCDYYDEAPGTCGNPPFNYCTVYDDAPGTCGNTDPGYCDVYNGAPGTCGNPGPELCPDGFCTVAPPCSIYTGRTGTTWCASPAEIAQDSIPDGPVPLVFESDDERNAEAILFDQAVEFAVQVDEPGLDLSIPGIPGLPDKPIVPDVEHEVFVEIEPLDDLREQQSSSASAQASSHSCSMTTCTVVFVRGYDFFNDGTGYGGWDPIRDWYLSNGYNHYEMVDIYGACVASATANPMTHGSSHADPHKVWFAGHHASATSCSPSGSHDLDTDMRHMAYHLAWWLYDTYGTSPVDVVAHSMGGLLIRYALTMVELKDPNWPPALNVDDAVTLATPHGGVKGAYCSVTVQRDNMCSHKSTMKWMKAHAQNPQGMAGTDWTLIVSDEDNAMSEKSGVGMTADHKLWYNKNTGGMENTAYDHNDYYKDGSDKMDGSYYWQKGGGTWYKAEKGPHAVKRAWWGSVSKGH